MLFTPTCIIPRLPGELAMYCNMLFIYQGQISTRDTQSVCPSLFIRLPGKLQDSFPYSLATEQRWNWMLKASYLQKVQLEFLTCYLYVQIIRAT